MAGKTSHGRKQKAEGKKPWRANFSVPGNKKVMAVGKQRTAHSSIWRQPQTSNLELINFEKFKNLIHFFIVFQSGL